MAEELDRYMLIRVTFSSEINVTISSRLKRDESMSLASSSRPSFRARICHTEQRIQKRASLVICRSPNQFRGMTSSKRGIKRHMRGPRLDP